MEATQVLVKPLRRWHPHELGCARWAWLPASRCWTKSKSFIEQNVSSQ